MYLDYKLKTVFSDFKVTELLEPINYESGDYNYYTLKKSGYKTIDVVDVLAEHFHLNKEDITYAGLKDEDGETIQYIAIKDFNIPMYEHNPSLENKTKYFTMNFMGTYKEPLKIGQLSGNNFNIRIRNLTKDIAEKIEMLLKKNIFAVNYYGIQRFGMPNSPKLTHLIGKSILEDNYNSALMYMKKTHNISDEFFNKWCVRGRDFLYYEDPRRINFFLSAWDSFVWNEKIKKTISDIDGNAEKIKLEGVSFLFSNKLELIFEDKNSLITRHNFIPNEEKNCITQKESVRAAVLEVTVKTSNIMNDELHNNMYMIDVNFTLPAGSYATTILDQIIWMASRDY